ncbi:MAG: hypothetical protein ACI8WT_003779 [Clostridium sp.]|jgi:hypothetical protein
MAYSPKIDLVNTIIIIIIFTKLLNPIFMTITPCLLTPRLFAEPISVCYYVQIIKTFKHNISKNKIYYVGEIEN